MNSKNRFIFFAILLLTLLLPFFILIGIQFYFLVSSSINNTIEIQDILSLLIESLSLISTIVLSVIAVLQTRKINAIEANDYDFFIYVKEIDETISLGENFIVPYEDEKMNSKFLRELNFSITHSIYKNKIVYLTFINLADKVEECKIRIIPLRIMTKNKLLITEISFRQINICVKYDNFRDKKDSFCKSLNGLNSDLSGVYDDGSLIPLLLGLCLPYKSSDSCIIDLDIVIQLKDQYGNILSYILKNKILCNEQGSFLLSSFTSKTNT